MNEREGVAGIPKSELTNATMLQINEHGIGLLINSYHPRLSSRHLAYSITTMASQTLPRRAALIGLSSTAVTSWASSAHLPGLLSTTGRSKIAIKALLNSSVDAAKSAIKTYNLPSDTKAYGSPDDLAADADIDLVICNTRVDKHYETIIPSVRAGKDVYVEWPIAAKHEHIEEIVETARKTGSRVAVGLQGRWAPVVVKLRELLDGGHGALGKVLSAEVRAYGGTLDREILPRGLKYFAQRGVGGNPIVIGFGHGTLPNLLHVSGSTDVYESSTSSSRSWVSWMLRVCRAKRSSSAQISAFGTPQQRRLSST
jgi:predicted dehydrogenase